MTDDPFAKFKIEHLSPSSLNCYIEQPSFWILKYLYRDRFNDQVGPSAWRGNAVEAGVDYYLMTQPDKRDATEAAVAALAHYDLLAEGVIEDAEQPKLAKERENIIPMLQQAINALHDKPVPDARQVKIELRLDGIEVPVQGFIDYVWPDECLDLKSTLRMPSEIPHAHARQVVTYTKAKQRPCALLYVTPAKFAFQRVVDVDTHFKYLEKQARAIRNLLWVADDREQAAKFFLPDPDHYWWTDKARTAAQTIWR